MDIVPVEIRYYRAPSGRVPFLDWLASLSADARALVDARLTRVERGLFGDVEPVGAGVFELRLHQGPGRRIYFGRRGRQVVLLLTGGDKASQDADVRKARRYWGDFLERGRR